MANIVQYIPYGGKKYPVRVSYYAIKQFQMETGKKLDELDEDFGLMESLLWFGLVAGHRAEGLEMTLRREDMELVLDESMDDFNTILMHAFPLPSEGTTGEHKKK